MNEKLKEIEVLENQVEEITNQLEDVSEVAYRLKSLMETIEKANDLMINDIQWFRKPSKTIK